MYTVYRIPEMGNRNKNKFSGVYTTRDRTETTVCRISESTMTIISVIIIINILYYNNITLVCDRFGRV